MKVRLFFSMGVLLASQAFSQGPWTWDLDTLEGRFSENQPTLLFSGYTTLLPASLWTAPGPGESLWFYYPEEGLLKVALGNLQAVLTIGAPQSEPTAFCLSQGALWVACSREVFSFLPGESVVNRGRLSLPVRSLFSGKEGPVAQVLGGDWYAWKGEGWAQVFGVTALSSSPEKTPGLPSRILGTQENQEDLLQIKNLMDRHFWEEAKAAQGLAREKQKKILLQDPLNQDALNQEKLLENLTPRITAGKRGWGTLSGELTPQGVNLAFLPDRLAPSSWVWELRFMTPGGEIVETRETSEKAVSLEYPQSLSPEDLLWVQGTVWPQDTPENPTTLRVISLKGLSFWLNSD